MRGGLGSGMGIRKTVMREVVRQGMDLVVAVGWEGSGGKVRLVVGAGKQRVAVGGWKNRWDE